MDSDRLDCVNCNLLIPSEIVVHLRERAKEKNVSIEHYINVLLYALTHNDPWNTHHENMREEIIKELEEKGRTNK